MIHWLASQLDAMPEWFRAFIVAGIFVSLILDTIGFALKIRLFFLRRKLNQIESL